MFANLQTGTFNSLSPENSLTTKVIPNEYLLTKMTKEIIRFEKQNVLSQRKIFILGFHIRQSVYPDQTVPVGAV